MECLDPEKIPNPAEMRKCEIKCGIEKAGLFDETGGIDEERSIKMMVDKDRIDEKSAKVIIGRCDLTKGDSEHVCDWADRGMTCIQKEKENYMQHTRCTTKETIKSGRRTTCTMIQ